VQVAVVIAQLLTALGLFFTPSTSGPVQTDWTFDLYSASGVRYQNPDYSACTAATVLMSLNLSAQTTSWSATTSYDEQKAVLAFERANMTMPTSYKGSDPHGARNALNYFGWGSMSAGIYSDVAWPTFGAAAKAVVSSIARLWKPAIVFAWGGGHAQLVTGYKTHGANPAISDDFTVTGIYLTDPLLGSISVVDKTGAHNLQTIGQDQYISLARWRSGTTPVRFSQYWQTESTYRDPIDGNLGKWEWYGKFVAVIAER